jgi:hypothetical protein
MLANFIISRRDHEYLDPCTRNATTNNTTQESELVWNTYHSLFGAMTNEDQMPNMIGFKTRDNR